MGWGIKLWDESGALQYDSTTEKLMRVVRQYVGYHPVSGYGYITYDNNDNYLNISNLIPLRSVHPDSGSTPAMLPKLTFTGDELRMDHAYERGHSQLNLIAISDPNWDEDTYGISVRNSSLDYIIDPLSKSYNLIDSGSIALTASETAYYTLPDIPDYLVSPWNLLFIKCDKFVSCRLDSLYSTRWWQQLVVESKDSIAGAALYYRVYAPADYPFDTSGGFGLRVSKPQGTPPGRNRILTTTKPILKYGGHAIVTQPNYWSEGFGATRSYTHNLADSYVSANELYMRINASPTTSLRQVVKHNSSTTTLACTSPGSPFGSGGTVYTVLNPTVAFLYDKP